MDSLLQNPELPEILLESKGQSLIADLDLIWCDAEEVVEPYRKLLVHDRDMTSALERFHEDAITLEILQARHSEGGYFREVVLRTAGVGMPVEYGLIEIELEAFRSGHQAAIVEGRQPLGGLLNETGMSYRSAPLGFFRVKAGVLGGVFSASSDGAEHFGRYNQLISDNGTRLARIIEILPAISTP